MAYTPTVWVDSVTKLGPTNMNHLETGLQSAAAIADAAIPAPGSHAGSNDALVWNGSAWVSQKITDASIAAAAAIAYSKLALTNSIINGDISAAAAIAASKLSGYPSDATKVLRGDGTWATISTTIAPSTTLPGSPTDTQQTILVDSTSAPTYAWLLQYVSAASKWTFIGGDSIYAEVTTSESTSSTTYAALTTAGPTITVPRAGDYFVEIGFQRDDGNAGHARMSYDIGATGAVDADCVKFRGSGASWTGMRPRKKTSIAASTALTAKYASVEAITTTYSNRTMRVTPIAVT